MTFQDLRNDGFTVMKHESINIMATRRLYVIFM